MQGGREGARQECCWPLRLSHLGCMRSRERPSPTPPCRLQVREELAFAITQPIQHPEVFEAMGLQAATGVLLFGPPGACAAARGV